MLFAAEPSPSTDERSLRPPGSARSARSGFDLLFSTGPVRSSVEGGGSAANPRRDSSQAGGGLLCPSEALCSTNAGSCLRVHA